MIDPYEDGILCRPDVWSSYFLLLLAVLAIPGQNHGLSPPTRGIPTGRTPSVHRCVPPTSDYF